MKGSEIQKNLGSPFLESWIRHLEVQHFPIFQHADPRYQERIPQNVSIFESSILKLNIFNISIMDPGLQEEPPD